MARRRDGERLVDAWVPSAFAKALDSVAEIARTSRSALVRGSLVKTLHQAADDLPSVSPGEFEELTRDVTPQDFIGAVMEQEHVARRANATKKKQGRRRCTVCGIEAAPANMKRHQKATGHSSTASV